MGAGARCRPHRGERLALPRADSARTPALPSRGAQGHAPMIGAASTAPVTNAPGAQPIAPAAEFFSPTSFWNESNAATQQVDSNSPAMIANLMQTVGSSNAGVYGPDAWPGAEDWWGVTATSFSVVGGVVTFNDLAAGVIDHALAIVLPDARYASYVAPAERDDGTSTSAGAIPESSRLRLDPSLNLASLNLPPIVRMLAQAAQRYGIYVRDYSPIVAFIGQDPTTSPYGSSLYGAAYDGISTGQLMQCFPWSHLQVVKQTVEYGW
jgi:hypothetical protein